MNIIPVDFTPQFRAQIATQIRYYGVVRVERLMLSAGYHSSFVSVLIRSIMGKEGW